MIALHRRQRRHRQLVAQSGRAPKFNLSDREYFQYFKNDARHGMFISELLINRVIGEQDGVLQPADHRRGRTSFSASCWSASSSPISSTSTIRSPPCAISRSCSCARTAPSWCAIRRLPTPASPRCRRTRHGTAWSPPAAAPTARREFSTTARAWCRRGRCAITRWWSMSRCPATRRSRIGAAARS